MGLREDLIRRMERKRAEIAELETKIRLAQEYLQALEDTFKIVPKDSPGTAESATLRMGTLLWRSRDAIRKAARPMHITELLEAMGKEGTRNARAGLSGTLSAYVRRGEIFTRPAPNTFGLVDLPSGEPQTKNDDPAVLLDVEPEEPVPPPGFGKL